MKKLLIWPCMHLDFSWSDAWFAIRACISFRPRKSAQLRNFGQPNHALVCMSVRCAFDLYLTSRSFEKGDEGIFIGVNVPDMFQIARSHGIRVIGVDIDPLTLAIRTDDLQSKISAKTRFVVVSQLFGTRLDMGPLTQITNSYDLDVIEDCAQAFAGISWSGSCDAKVSLFSFGPLKTSTAFQGAIAVVRDSNLFETMTLKHRNYPVQRNMTYFKNVLRCCAMKLMSQRLIFSLVVHLLELLDFDHETVIHHATKSTSLLPSKHPRRERPCAALIAVLDRNLANSEAKMVRRIEVGEFLTTHIGRNVKLVARNQRPNCFWMVPVLTEDPLGLKNHLRRVGFDALSSRLCAPSTAGLKGSSLLENAVMLPFSPQMSQTELKRLGEAVTARR